MYYIPTTTWNNDHQWSTQADLRHQRVIVNRCHNNLWWHKIVLSSTVPLNPIPDAAFLYLFFMTMTGRGMWWKTRDVVGAGYLPEVSQWTKTIWMLRNPRSKNDRITYRNCLRKVLTIIFTYIFFCEKNNSRVRSTFFQ